MSLDRSSLKRFESRQMGEAVVKVAHWELVPPVFNGEQCVYRVVYAPQCVGPTRVKLLLYGEPCHLTDWEGNDLRTKEGLRVHDDSGCALVCQFHNTAVLKDIRPLSPITHRPIPMSQSQPGSCMVGTAAKVPFLSSPFFSLLLRFVTFSKSVSVVM
jgi:hypothetical protein